MSYGPKVAYTREQVEDVARRYRTTGDAARALGISSTNFGRLCRRHGIQTPTERTRQRDTKQED